MAAPEAGTPDASAKKRPVYQDDEFWEDHKGCLVPLPWTLSLPQVIYIYRNPKDVMVSMYHWLRGLRAVGFDRDIRYLVDEMVKPQGKIMYAPYFDNIAGYWKIRNQPNIFVCSYEQMRKNFHASVKELATFLGKELSDEQIQRICHECSFAEMQANPVTNRQERDHVVGVYDSQISPYIRKGAVGKWHDTMDEESSKKIDEWIQQNLSRPDLIDFGFEFE
ncbi:sulfotransferase 1C2-like isoform X2 [Paramacrobiotus metropolitanus]|uniref:sulfotransferase 1C2-like isoform X2 n=1 Tax=Paramacrobiotus metropolitanus TaxID=2943436 RepID=UPI0024462A8B|nr:sulfotransferase 1C2-like isoform X2 [Paramacrobiotus metropolitanus]